MEKLLFSGHESFHCRSLWLKKGYDFLLDEKKFNDQTAVIDLGVGKNMVSSINYWMKSFGLVRNNKLSEFADSILNNDGFDPYLEDIATLWLLHYYLVTENHASIYSLVFNEFRKKRIEFNKKHLEQYIRFRCEETNSIFNENTIKRDMFVFLKMYVKPARAIKNLEDVYSGLFIDLDLIEPLKKFDEEEASWYRIENKERKELPCEVILYCILDNEKYGKSITFDELLFDFNSVGNIFAINSKNLLEKLEEISSKYKSVVLTDDAGIRLIQFKKDLNKLDILKGYYEK